jgi:hypothetical protein
VTDTTDFFEEGVVYTDREHPYQAPGNIHNFWVERVTTIPDTGLRIAFGFYRRENEPDWVGTGLMDDRWGPHWKIKHRVEPSK